MGELVIFDARCSHRSTPMHYWLEPAKDVEGATLHVTILYKCKFGCRDGRYVASAPSEVRDTDGKRIPRRVP